MKTSDVLKINDDQFIKQLDMYDAIPKSRILTKDEEHEMAVRVAEMEHTLKKCSGGKLVSAELQPIVTEFEAAGYNLNNLNPKVRNSLQNTYDELRYCVESDPKTFKNTSAKLYCDLYELFQMNKVSEAMSKMKNTKFFKSSKFGKESISIESLEAYLAETDGVQSTEGFVDNFFTKLLHKSQVPAAANTFQSGMLIVCILLFLVTIAIVTLCVINMQYKTELSKILDKLADDDVKTKGALKCHQDNVREAAIAVEEKTPAITKMTVLKAAKYSTREIKKFAKADYTELDRSVESFNQECSDIIAQSREDGTAAAVVEKTLLDKFIDFLSKSKKGIAIAVGIGLIIGLIKVGIPLIRSSIYHFKSWRVRMSNFFDEQSELTEANIEYLIEQRDNPATSEMERERLDKIIKKQRVWIKNMTAWSNMFYKAETDANSDTMYEIRQDEKVDFDKIASEAENAEEASIDEIDSPVATTTTDETPTGTKSVVLF